MLVSANDHSRNLALDNLGLIGAADHNRYFHTLNTGWQVVLTGKDYGLAQWQTDSQKDKHSQSDTPDNAARLQLYTNDTAADKTISSLTGTFQNLDRYSLGASFILPPYTSVVVAFILN